MLGSSVAVLFRVGTLGGDMFSGGTFLFYVERSEEQSTVSLLRYLRLVEYEGLSGP